MKKVLHAFVLFVFLTAFSKVYAQPEFSWSGFTAGSLNYSTSSAGVTMNLVITGNMQFINNRPSYNGFHVQELTTQVDWTSAGNALTYTIQFSQPLIGVNFRIYDIDQNTGAGWDDRAIITGKGAGNADVYPLIIPASYNSVTGIHNNILEGNQDNIFFDLNPATVTFGNQVIQSLTIVYTTGAQSPAAPNQQWMGIGVIGTIGLGALPVTLTSFSGKTSGNDAKLNWETAAQVNFDHFEVERSATGFGSFSAVGTVAAVPGTAGSYAFTDANAGRTLNTAYYRLKMVDHDGRYQYSRVVFLLFGKGISIDVRPTVLTAGQPITLNIARSDNKISEVSMFNISGQLVRSKISAASGSTEISTSGLQTGLYILKVADGQDIKSFKVILQ